MIVLDADSIVSGDTLVRLVALIERSPHAGLVQTRPQAINRRSLFGRIHQFAGRIYGPMFAAGLHWWQLGDGQYWGHNAVIRTDAFMKTCGLPKLSGKPPLGGEILSHDFVEAALLGRSGWELWLAYDLEGTYEETPSSLLEEMKRDRRWCQGNLQHSRLIFARGLRWAHRSLFLNGIFSYASAVIWFAFVVVSTYQAVADVFFPVDYFPHGRSLFPDWPVWDPSKAITLAGVTAVVLFVPKVLGVLYVIAKRQVHGFGGFFRLITSVLLEIVFSTLMAPIRMVFHTRFVVLESLRSHGRLEVGAARGRGDRLARSDSPARGRRCARACLGLGTLSFRSLVLLVDHADSRRARALRSALRHHQPRAFRRSRASGSACS